MSEIRTLLLDPQSHNSQRSVFTIPRGLNIKASKIRLCNVNISNDDGNQIYFNHSGVYSLLSKVSVVSLQGSEIDRLSALEIMSIRLMHMENGSQYSVNRQLSQNMCNSVFVNNLGQVDLTEQSQRDDGSLMQVYIDVSFCLNYLQRRTKISEGMTVLFEWQAPDVLGFNWHFSLPPCLAVDEYLTSVPDDPMDIITFPTIIQDKLIVPVNSTGFEKRLNAFYNQYITNVYFMDIQNRNSNPLVNAIAQNGAVLEATIDGRKKIPLKGIDTSAKKLAFLQDFSGGHVTIPGYDSAINLINNWRGLHNPNNGLDYENKFSYGAFALNQFINMDFTLSYNFTNPVPAGESSGYTLLIMAEVLRSYDRVNDKVSNVTSPSVPA
jgi:hypothetical protein